MVCTKQSAIHPIHSHLESRCNGHVWVSSVSILACHINTFKTLKPRQDGRYFADDIFKCIFLNENAWISLEISLKFVPKVRINNIPALVQIMAWRRPGNKPLSEPMMDNLLTHICVTRPQWVKTPGGGVIRDNPLVPVGHMACSYDSLFSWQKHHLCYCLNWHLLVTCQ